MLDPVCCPYAAEKKTSAHLEQQLLDTQQEAAVQAGALDESQQHAGQLTRHLAEVQAILAKQKQSHSALADSLEAVKHAEASAASQLTRLKEDLAAAQAAGQEADQAASSTKTKWQTAERSLQAEKEALQVTFLNTPPGLDFLG